MEAIKKQLHDFIIFIRLLLKKWILWLFLILDVIALIVQYISPSFYLSQWVYLLIASIGIVWAGFEVYSELLKEHRRIIGSQAHLESKIESKTEISLIEGNEYSYRINDPYQTFSIQREIEAIKSDESKISHTDEHGIFFVDGIPFYRLSHSYLDVNFRIINTGDIAIDLLSIESFYNDHIFYNIRFNIPVFYIQDQIVTYPIKLDKGETAIFRMTAELPASLLCPAAQFAADIVATEKLRKLAILIDTLDANGLRKTYNSETINFSLRPLSDLYISQWQKYYQDDLLRLAGIKPIK